MPFEFLEDIATADVALRVWGTTREEILAEAAEGLLAVMVDNPEAIEEIEYREVLVSAKSLEMLLFESLQQLIYLKDADEIFLRIRNLVIKENHGFSMKADAYGERINPDKYHLNVDVKAVTLHRLQVKESRGSWEATLVFDI